MNWNDLKYFLALSREGSVSGAGRVLGVKHTTVARRIRALEKSLGTRLFDRSRQGYAMTQAAENLFQQALSIEEQTRSINQKIANQDSILEGPLKLTAAFELANRLLIPEIHKFCFRYPGIDMQLLMTKGLLDLSAMEADVAIRMTTSPPDYLIGRELMKMPNGIYGSKEVLEDSSKPTRVILFKTEKIPPPWVQQHFPDAEIVLRIDDVGSMAVAASHGLGIARLPCFIGDTEIDLLRIDRPIEQSPWGIWMLNHIDLRSTARVRACKEYICELMESKRSLVQGKNSRYF